MGRQVQFVKVDSDIRHSTIWEASPAIRCVWFALMTMSDYEGNVWATEEALVREANVRPVDVRKALALFTSPDPKSRCQDHEGRRLIPLSRGWHIVTFRQYFEWNPEDRTTQPNSTQLDLTQPNSTPRNLAEPNSTELSTAGGVKSAESFTSASAEKKREEERRKETICPASGGIGLRQGSEQIQTSRRPGLLDGMPPFGPAAFSLLFGQWPGQANSRFNEKPADAEAAFFANVTEANYPAFIDALNIRLTDFDADKSPDRRFALGTFRTFCESRWQAVKPHPSDPISTAADPSLPPLVLDESDPYA